MRYLPPAVLDMLDSGQIVMHNTLRFAFGSGNYAFWTGSRPQMLDGILHLPGSVIEVEAVNASVGMEAIGLQISLAQSPEDGLTPDVLATFDAEDYHQRPVTISDIYIDPKTLAIVYVEPVYRGYVDTAPHEDGPNGRLVINCESRALDNTREGYRMRSSADQQLILPGDRFFEHAELAGKVEIFWGRERV